MAKEIEYQRVSDSKSGLPKVQGSDPEYAISLVGLIMSVAGQPLVGLILGAIGLKQSKAAGRSNTLALLGVIFGGIFTFLGLLLVILYVVIGVFAFISQGQGTF